MGDLGGYIGYSRKLIDLNEIERQSLQNELLRARIQALKGRGDAAAADRTDRYLLGIFRTLQAPKDLHPIAQREAQKLYMDFLNKIPDVLNNRASISDLIVGANILKQEFARLEQESKEYNAFEKDVMEGKSFVTPEQYKEFVEADDPFGYLRSAVGFDLFTETKAGKAYVPVLKPDMSLDDFMNQKSMEWLKTRYPKQAEMIKGAPGLMRFFTNIPEEEKKRFVEEYFSDHNKVGAIAYEAMRSGKIGKSLEKQPEIEEEAKRYYNVVRSAAKAATLFLGDIAGGAQFSQAVKGVMPPLQAQAQAPQAQNQAVQKGQQQKPQQGAIQFQAEPVGLRKMKEAIIQQYKDNIKNMTVNEAVSMIRMIPEIRQAVLNGDKEVLSQVKDPMTRAQLMDLSDYVQERIKKFWAGEATYQRYRVKDAQSPMRGTSVEIQAKSRYQDTTDIGIVNVVSTIAKQGVQLDNKILHLASDYVPSVGPNNDINTNAVGLVGTARKPEIGVTIPYLDVSFVPVSGIAVPEFNVRAGDAVDMTKYNYARKMGLHEHIKARPFVKALAKGSNAIVYIPLEEVRGKIEAVYGKDVVEKIIETGLKEFAQSYYISNPELWTQTRVSPALKTNRPGSPTVVGKDKKADSEFIKELGKIINLDDDDDDK